MIPSYHTERCELHRFKRIRKDMGITLAQLEKSTQIPRGRIAKYEKGTSQIPYYIVVRFSRFFQMPPEELFPEISMQETGKVLKTWTDFVDEYEDG